MELEEAGGIEILSDTLRDLEATEEEKSEAAGLLAQGCNSIGILNVGCKLWDAPRCNGSN